MTILSLEFPSLGLNKNEKLATQPPLSSRDLMNVWPQDSTTGRKRGSTRPGTSSYFSGFLGGSGNKVQAIHSLPYQARHVSYAADPIPDELWAVSLTGNPTISCIVAGLFDDFFAVIGNTLLVHYSRYGITLGSVELLDANPDLQINAMHVDGEGSIYVATTTWISSFASVSATNGSRIWKYALDVDNRGLVYVWSVIPVVDHTFAGLYVVGDSLYTLETENTIGGTAAITRMWRYLDINTYSGPVSGSHNPVSGPIHGSNINAVETAPKVYPTGSTNAFAHDFYVKPAGVEGETAFYIAVGTQRLATAGVWAIMKLTSSAGYQITAPYLFVNDETSAVDAFHGGGIGFAIRADVTGNVYSMGRRNANDSGSGNWVRKLVDTGTAWSKVQGWARENATDLGGAANNPTFGYPRITLDAFSNLIVPTCFSDIAVDAAKVVKNDGSLFTSIRHREDVTTPPTINNTNNDCRAVAVPVTHPEFQPNDYKITDTVFVAGSNVITMTSEAAGASIHGYDILLETPSPVSSRAIARLGVAAGGIYRFTTAGTQVPTNSTGRDPVLNANARFVQCADAKGEVFFTDGQNYCVYRPMPGDATNPNGEIVEWRASSLGVIPPRARLICRWRGRIVLAHTADSPYAWHMSAFDDPYNWDLDPPEVLETQAVSGSALEALGNVPDLIHALIPWSDDLLFIGCSRSILRLSGDPMAGGRLDVVSDEVGMAFGTPWCKDPEGRIYFFGAKGGIYVMGPTGDLTWLTRDTIENDLSDIDLSTFRVELTWNARDNGLHVWVMPYASGGTHVRHYFWSQRTTGWFPVEMGTSAYTAIQPTAVHGSDGDTAIERVMLIGTENGQVLQWDPASAFDADQPIYRKVLIGPLAGPYGDFAARFKRPTVVLARELGGCNVRFFASSTPETPLMPRAGIRVGPGRNQRLPIQARGSWLWLELSSASRVGSPDLSEMWAVESLSVEGIVAGRVHAAH